MIKETEYIPTEPVDIMLQKLLTHQNQHSQKYEKMIKELERHNIEAIRRREDKKSLEDLETLLTTSGMINIPGARETLERMKREKNPCQLSHRELWNNLIDNHPELLDWLTRKLHHYPLFDLGGGTANDILKSGLNVFPYIADQSEASIYVNVDIFLRQPEDVQTATSFKNVASDEEQEQLRMICPNTQIALVQADMLDFISRLKENAGNFIINGIDRFVIPDPEYHTALAKELARATKKGGIVMGYNSEVLKQLDPSIFKPAVGLGAEETSIPIIFVKQ